MIEEKNGAVRTALEMLLDMTPTKPQVKQFLHKRLSREIGDDFIIKLQGIGYSRVAEIRRMSEQDEAEVYTLLSGLVEPSLKNKQLLEKYASPTPAELAKAIFLPGEIAEMAREIEQLSGYRDSTLEELEKN